MLKKKYKLEERENTRVQPGRKKGSEIIQRFHCERGQSVVFYEYIVLDDMIPCFSEMHKSFSLCCFRVWLANMLKSAQFFVLFLLLFGKHRRYQERKLWCELKELKNDCICAFFKKSFGYLIGSMSSKKLGIMYKCDQSVRSVTQISW